MWSVDDLKRAAEKRNEHVKLAPDVERVILAAERALGRTEEVLRRELAKNHLKTLLAVLDMNDVPDHVRARHPVFPVPPLVKPAPLVPLPMPPSSFDRNALVAELKAAEASLKVGETGAPAKVVNLEPQSGKDRQRSVGGPSR
jgi:hypothetical protein